MLEQATKLDNGFLLNQMNYDAKLSALEENNLYTDYYLRTCAYIHENHFTQPNIEIIEDVLNGAYLPTDRQFSIVCTISDIELRKYLFKQAMAKQMIYDLENGRNSMQKVDHIYDVCPEFKTNLTMLGFIKSGVFSRNGK